MAKVVWTVEAEHWLRDVVILGVFHGALDIDRYLP